MTTDNSSESERVLRIDARLSIPIAEIELDAVRAQGPGGQNVNKVATAVQLRFDIRASSLPARYKARLLARADRRISRDGVLIIKAQTERSREANRLAALARLRELIVAAGRVQRARIPTRPTRGSAERRLKRKQERAGTKRLRGRVEDD